ncbi:AAA family ATPase [Rhodococcus sp. MEB041]|uniref:bifunctional aminoglycoside phosphotransferase/ATP-binding protein n=1 Tax=Rhodococcus sp. MEB041 TaxID=3040323 RepID=UPI00254EE8B1|nr:AAA family ATPase [Rhodococcus sp. MEB041]
MSPEDARTVPARAEVRETHSAYVILIGDTAYKMKKPVRTAFLDFSSVISRRHALEREHTLNARFAPDVYRGVGDLTDPSGGPAEPVLWMRRLPDAERLSTLARDRTRELDDDLDAIARQVAGVHTTSRRTARIDRGGSSDSLAGRWAANLLEARGDGSCVLDDTMLDEIESCVETFLGGRAALIDRRIEEGRIVDGHGDLLADDIFCAADGPRILDCLDFDDALRFLDGIDDAACLAMDLEFQGRADLARQFIRYYRDAAFDLAPPALVHHYIAHRAFVRAKVACIRDRQGDDEARSDAVDHARLALDHLHAGTVTLTIVGGLPGTGKTTLATYMAENTDSVVISSDVVRKSLAGFAPTTSHTADVGRDLYAEEMTHRTYDAMLNRAHAHLAGGHSVVLDASWMDPTLRARAEALAAATRSTLVQIECSVPASVALERVSTRTGSASDATTEVYRDMARRRRAWPASSTVVTTTDRETAGDAALAHWRLRTNEPVSAMRDGAGVVG